MTPSPVRRRATRRDLLKASLAGAAGAIILPTFIPRTYLSGAEPGPSKRINVAQIGVGRMGSGDMGSVMASSLCQMVAVCDLDAKRLEIAKGKVEEHYKKKGGAGEVKSYHDYHDVLARTDIDAVVISLPDHWHAQAALEAVLAGKDVYVQKPMTYNIAESIALRTAVHAKKRILQVGSQQRSGHSFRRATELVRNGAIGKLHTIKIGVGKDKPSGKSPKADPVPATFDYETWLGAAPEQPYMEGRVHPQNSGSGRPGWITTEDFGLGMITNWGAHHIDIAQWGMGMELSGPTTIEAQAEFMQNDVWTVHTTYHIELTYPNGVHLIMDDKFDNGIRFEGANGWVFCTRGAERVTASDPNAPADNSKALKASDPAILNTTLPDSAKLWMPSTSHYVNWLEHVLSHTEPIAPVDQGARSLSTCAASWIGMKLKRKLTWDPEKECFPGDAEANALCSRKPRKSDYDIQAIMKKAGLA